MEFDPPLVRGTFLRRYKRFFVDVELDDGRTIVAHCTNTGRLTGCMIEGAPVMLRPESRPTRKLRWTWMMIDIDGEWVGVDPTLAPTLVREAIETGVLTELEGYDRTMPEVRYGSSGRSRIDLLLSRGGRAVEPPRKGARVVYENDERVYVEVKNTTLAYDRDVRVGAFPDAVTERGLKHVYELAHVVEQGHRGALVFSLQRSDCEVFEPAADVDPKYASGLREAVEAGVETYALAADIDPTGVRLVRQLPMRID